MKQAYHVVERRDCRALSEFLSKDGQLLLPLLELIEKAEPAVDELIDVAGRSTIEAVLTLSAEQVAGAKHPGKENGEIRWHGQQRTAVAPWRILTRTGPGATKPPRYARRGRCAGLGFSDFGEARRASRPRGRSSIG